MVDSVGTEQRATFFRDKVVCVTGGAGSVGRQLIGHLLQLPLRELRALDNDENDLYELGQLYRDEPRLKPIYCDISHSDQVDRCLRGCQLIFHAAAVKHVPGCETAPWAAVNVNIRGLSHVVDAALRHNVDRLVFTSSDKAVNPTNVMGASKLVGEKLALASHLGNGHTIIACTRFGNVAGTRGSVIPLFCDQIREGGPITLTSPDMTRFFMSIEDAGALVIDSMMSARHGEIFVTRMQTMRIEALAGVMRRLVAPALGRIPAGIEIAVCGLRPGEKLHEELITEEECRRSFSTSDYIVVMPIGSRPGTLNQGDYPLLGDFAAMSDIYHSGKQTALDDAGIEAFLLDHALLPKEVRSRAARPRRTRPERALPRQFELAAMGMAESVATQAPLPDKSPKKPAVT